MSSKNGHLREFDEFCLDTEKRVLWFRDRPVNLALKEIDLLCVLTENCGEVVTKDELLDRVWSDSIVEESNLSRHIYLLRKSFKNLGAGDLIETVPRRGYRFAGELRTNGNLVIERHAITRTLIEEVPRSEAEPLRRDAVSLRHGLSTVGIVCLLMGAIIGIIAFSAEWQSSAVPIQIRSIAVLPFTNINGGDDAEYAGLGIADLLITRLSNIREINVRPTGSIIGIAGTDTVAAGQRLDVDAIVEGTLFRTTDKVRATARLVRVSTSEVIWAGEFEKTLEDELKLQDDIAAELVDALALNLSGSERKSLTRKFTESPEAYQLYVKGRFHWNKRNAEGMYEAQRLFRNAIEKDPKFALAYVGLADTLAMSELSPPVVSLQSVNRALELEPDLAEAHATLGFIRMLHEWQWDLAETSFVTSIRLNPNYATARHWYATLLAIRGRNDEAKAEMRRALEIDPLSHNLLADLGQLHYFAEEYSEAEEYCRRALAIDPGFVLANAYLHDIHLRTGDFNRAAEVAVRRHFIENPQLDLEKMDAAISAEQQRFGNLGKDRYLRTSLHKVLHPNHSYHNAGIYALTGEKEKALSELEKAFEGRAFLSAFVKADPVFAELREEPRFREILSKMNLTD